ncbi:MAG: MFS transporter [Gaiellales bacterium]
MTPPAETTRPSTVLIARVSLIAIGIGWNFAIIGPIARQLASSFEVTLGMVGLLTTLLLVTHALSQLPAAEPAQRIGPLKLVRFAFLLVAAANLLAALSPVFWLLGAARLIVGIGTGPVFVGGLDGTRRLGGAFLAGIFGGAATLGLGLALVVGAGLESSGASWRWSFVIAAVIALLASAFGPRDSDEPRPHAGSAIDHLGAVLRSRPLWRLAMIHSASFGSSLVMGAWIVTHLVNGHASTFVAGAVGFMLLAVAAVFRPVGGALFARGVPWYLLGPGAAIMSAAALGLIALQPPTWLAAIESLFIGIGYALPFSAVFVLSVRAEPRYPAAAIAFVNMTGAVFALVLTPFAGVMMDHDIGGVAFAVLGAFALISAFVARRPVPGMDP